MTEVLSQTESVCPECLRRLPALRVLHGGDVYLEKTCPEHGDFQTLIWRGEPGLDSWVRPKTPSFPAHPTTAVTEGCPYDCGLCSDHRQHTCSVLLEITGRCDLQCPVCFADSGAGSSADWPLAGIETWYRRLQQTADSSINIQLSGGEPCVRHDLPEIIRLGHSYGFKFFQLNTNGLRLAHDTRYLAELKSAGLSTIFLQFDGTQPAIYRQMRGRDLLEEKTAVIRHCVEQGVAVVLVPTLLPGVNTAEVGNIIRFALAHAPVVRGVHFQPISYMGRYPAAPSNETRITIPEVIQAIESQTDGLIRKETFCPPGCENAACSFHGNYVIMPDGELKALTRHRQAACSCKPAPAAEGAARTRQFVATNWSAPPSPAEPPVSNRPVLGGWDTFLERRRTHMFCVSGMAFQDAWNLDLERLRDCCIHIASPDGRLVPFCAYNLTDRQGRPLYRRQPEAEV